jgi:hypothetical protein
MEKQPTISKSGFEIYPQIHADGKWTIEIDF